MSEDREDAIRRLVPLVRRIARRIVRLVPGADLDDLIGDGCVGIIRAVDGFDPNLGTSLEQYARRVALGAMLNGVRRLDPVSERVRRVIRVAEREAVRARRRIRRIADIGRTGSPLPTPEQSPNRCSSRLTALARCAAAAGVRRRAERRRRPCRHRDRESRTPSHPRCDRSLAAAPTPHTRGALLRRTAVTRAQR